MALTSQETLKFRFKPSHPVLIIPCDMGQGQSSTTSPREVSTEQLSHELALRFASRCYTHLEIAHFKDNFKTLADHQDGIEYWKEETLTRFLMVPESLRAAPVLYQMSTYLGAFPFPGLAPCILTREATLKVITIFTGRYKKVLKRGQQDKVKLLFRSLAVYDRRASIISPSHEKPSMKTLVAEQKPYDVFEEEDGGMREMRSHIAGWSVDEPANDDEEEDDDDLVLAALDSLDAIEVFKEDQRVDRRIHHAVIPSENLKNLVVLLLAISSLRPQEILAVHAKLDSVRLGALQRAANSIIASFDPEPVSKGIRYATFVKTVSTSLPQLFEPLNPLFEHFLFSKNIDLSKHRDAQTTQTIPQTPVLSQIIRPMAEGVSSILNDAVLAQVATFASSSGADTSSHLPSFLHNNTQFHPLYSTMSHGTSLSSFSRLIGSWSASTLLLITGIMPDSNDIVTIGAYLPTRWTDSSSSSQSVHASAPKAVMFQLSPRHAVFPSNAYSKSPLAYFSKETGLAVGCIIPPASRTHAAARPPILGPVSLLIDSDISNATFQHDGDGGTGAFLTDPILEEAQHRSKGSGHLELPRKLEFEIDSLEVWGITTADDSGEEEVTKHEKHLAWEEAEAARRQAVNFGGDKDGARALLEMAGVVGADAHNRSGGSV